MSNKCIEYYKTGAKVCGRVYRQILKKLDGGETDVKSLCEFGTAKINEECKNVCLEETQKGVAIPVTISLNNCVGNYFFEEGNELYNRIKDGDVVKIELGVNIGGCISVLGETYIKGDHQLGKKLVSVLSKLQKKVSKIVKHGETNDEVRVHVEEFCSENDCFPVENCIGYQHLEGQLKTEESKYIVFNHQKYYDEDDNLAVEANLCFEFEEGEVYTVNLTVVPNNTNGEEHVYKEPHGPHLYRLNNYRYSLKLKSSREFYSKVKAAHGNNAFYSKQCVLSAKDKLGMKECYTNGILDDFPVLYHKNPDMPIVHKKFTLVVLKDSCIPLDY